MRREALVMLAGAVALFGLVLSISRLDVGAPGRHQRGNLEVETHADSVEIVYGPTHYPFLWVVADGHGGLTQLVPSQTSSAPYGHHTKSEGERIRIARPPPGATIFALLSPVPRPFSEIRDALSAQRPLSGQEARSVIGAGP